MEINAALLGYRMIESSSKYELDVNKSLKLLTYEIRLVIFQIKYSRIEKSQLNNKVCMLAVYAFVCRSSKHIEATHLHVLKRTDVLN